MIGILSDTHDHRPMTRRAVEFFNRSGVRLVIHAGDFVAPFSARDLRALECPLVGVFGNCDGDRAALEKALAGFGTLHGEPHRLEVEGRHIVVAHCQEAAEAAGGDADVLIFGHTHRPEITPGRPLRVNSGECSGWLTGRSTIALLDPEELKVDLVDL